MRAKAERGGRRRVTTARQHLARTLFALCCFFAGRSGAAATHVWIDTDPSIGAPYREVDDAYALVLAFHSPEVRIAGISTTFGNAGVNRTTAVTRDLVRNFGGAAGLRESDVHAGAASASKMGSKTAASEALAAALQTQRLTYVALGPLTNLATFVRLHPRLARRIDRVVFVGGQTPGHTLAFGPSGGLRIHDANVFKDPAAARVVLQSALRLSLAPAETGGNLLITPDGARRLSSGGRAAKFLQRNSRLWLWFWTKIVRHPGGPVFDSLAVAMIARPHAVATATRYASVTDSGELIAARRRSGHARVVTFCTRPGDGTTEWMLTRTCRDPAAPPRR